LTEFAPSFHGLYRALISTPFPWSTTDWYNLSASIRALFATDVVERLNRLLVDILKAEDADADTLRFIQTLLSRYVGHGRPLTGYFLVCCSIEAQWTVLAQSICVFDDGDVDGGDQGTFKQRMPEKEYAEAAAANRAWLALMQGAVETQDDMPTQILEALKLAIAHSMQCFTDFLVQIEDMDQEPSEDSYAWETMSESLVSLPLLETGRFP
jgi:phosphatidylinositol 4-kinase A